MSAPFLVEALAGHDRSAFSSGVQVLDRYFRIQVTQDVRRRVASCYVAVEAETARVAGFYTIAAASIPTPDLPETVRKKFRRDEQLSGSSRVSLGLRMQSPPAAGRSMDAPPSPSPALRCMIWPPSNDQQSQ
ncbi:MAG: hypothetical protein GX607_12775 [Myxococcales bacterium]|nr:hypothetical protein [Myxococcales bacterium]